MGLKEQILESLNNSENNFNQRLKINGISYDLFCELMTASVNSILKRRNESNQFEICQHTSKVLKSVYAWLNCEETINFNRGLFIAGNYGCGKSLMLESFYKVYKEIAKNTQLLKSPSYWKSDELQKHIEEKGFSDALTKFPLFIDEIGREPLIIKNYGNDNKPMVELILKRWDNGALTFCTSNFKIETLGKNDKYGEMIGDRFKQMFNFIEFKGESKRK
jgi:DNA replication protein DnaC